MHRTLQVTGLLISHCVADGNHEVSGQRSPPVLLKLGLKLQLSVVEA